MNANRTGERNNNKRLSCGHLPECFVTDRPTKSEYSLNRYRMVKPEPFRRNHFILVLRCIFCIYAVDII